MICRPFLLACFSLLISSAARGDDAPPLVSRIDVNSEVPLDGQVLGKGDRVPLAGVAVIVDEGPAREVTDLDGRFHFTALPIGSHVLHLRATQIPVTEAPVTLSAGKRTEVTLFVAAKQRYTSVVRGQKAVVETVEHVLAAEEIKRIPGTQGDTLKAVQSLPGVARVPFGGGQLVVWGSSPEDTRVYVDGVFIPVLYHFGGLRSTVNGEVVNALSFFPGGYGVEHGRGLGGVVEIDTRQPKTTGYHGFVQLDLIDGSLLLEGPITKNLSFSVSARRSWIDAFLPLFTTNDFQLSPVYYDYQAKLAWRASRRDDVDVFIFGSDDKVSLLAKSPNPNLDVAVDSHNYYHRILARWVHRFPGRETLTITPSIGYDVPFQVAATLGNQPFNVDAEMLSYALRATARVPLTKWLRIDAGLDFEGTRNTLGALVPARGQPREGDPPGFGLTGGILRDNTVLYIHNTAPFVSLDFSFFDKKLSISPQFRLDVYSIAGYLGTPDAYSHTYVEPEPRLALRYQIRPWVAVKAALGLYHQVPDPVSLTRFFGNPSVSPTTALQYVLGLELDPTPTLHIEAEGFYKDLRNLIVRGETATDPIVENDGQGRVYGGELLIRQELWKNFFGWISYTISRAERRDHPDEPWRLFQFDQTHIFTILGSYKLPRGYQVGLRFRYVTGNPRTPVTGSYFDATSGAYTPIYGPVYSARNPAFHQLDLRFDKTWTFNRWALSAYLDIQNLYNAQTPEGLAYNFDFTQSRPVSGLPFLPVLGLRGDF
jgi:hypothetical protein